MTAYQDPPPAYIYTPAVSDMNHIMYVYCLHVHTHTQPNSFTNPQQEEV